MTPAIQRNIRFAIVALCIIAFLPVFTADFVNYDDPEYILKNIYIQDISFKNIKQIFFGKTTDLFVPLTVFSYSIEYSVFGANAKAFHSVNLILHIINALLLFQILLNLQIKNTSVVVLLITFFSVNPLVTESVCWITERKDILYCLFYFLSVIQFLKYQNHKVLKHLLWCFIWFLLSCLSKPMAVSLPVLFSIYIVYHCGKIDIKKQAAFIPFYILSAIFSIISVKAIDSLGTIKSSITEYSLIEKSGLVLSEIGYYFFKPFMPFNQSLFHLFLDKHLLFSNPSILIYLALAVFLIVLIYYFAIIKKQSLIGWLFLAWVVFLIPILQIYPNTHSYISERYFYISILFPVAIVLILLEYHNIRLFSSIYATGAIALLFTGLTFQQSTKWKNTKTLFEYELKQDAENPFVLNNLGLYYNTKEDYSKAAFFLQKAVASDSTNAFYLNNYGWSLAAMNNNNEAITYFQKAIHQKSDYTEALNNLGICYIKTQQYNEAYNCFKKAYDLSPDNPDVLFNLGLFYYNSHQKELGLPLLQKAYKLGNHKAAKYLNN